MFCETPGNCSFADESDTPLPMEATQHTNRPVPACISDPNLGGESSQRFHIALCMGCVLRDLHLLPPYGAVVYLFLLNCNRRKIRFFFLSP